ncbi:sensor histidine kinase [Paenibacillus aceti]|uniref:Two-component sensor kinase n=1 Tax=Paenibacillus aceti TaxID=1820010 RepID=A0ABQ1W2N5_9BACL|nr:sensor histidine kinase [Paenibacillus aceti]GGG11284.1 putative two-component sensor kinase [Paenibacillus aceti]
MFLMKRSLFAKILLSMLITTAVPLLISNYLSYQIIGRSVKEQLVQLNQSSMAIKMSSITKYIHDISMLSYTYYGDPELMRLLTKEEVQTPVESVYMKQKIARNYAGFSEIRSIIYKSALTNKQITVKSELNERIPMPDFNDHLPGAKYDELDQEYSVVEFNGERRLRINKAFINASNRELLGMTTMTVRDTILKQLANPLGMEEENETYIFLQDNLQLLYSTPGVEGEEGWIERLREESGSSKGMINDSRGIYIYFRDADSNIPVTLVRFIPQSVIDQAGKQALNESFTIQLIVTVFVTIMAGLISYFILFRVKRILKHIKNIQMGNFDIQMESRGSDELAVLEDRFQEMVRQLDILWNQQYRYQLEVSTARLKMLQAQINPHFLFNTLQSIGSLAIKKNAPEVSDKIAELGAMFRYSMDIDTEEVRLQDELDHLNHYISLQMGRYQERIQFTQSCAEEALDLHIPKMILQPLVENSIIHGIEKGEGIGEIRVEIEAAEKLLIRIIDNGRGFSPETIQEIHNQYSEQSIQHDSRTRIGLINVFKRLQLYCGAGFAWRIESEPFIRTTITLELPYHQEKEQNVDESLDRG